MHRHPPNPPPSALDAPRPTRRGTHGILALGLAVLAWPVAHAAPGLCTAQETVYFSCPAAHGRWIALCGSVSSASPAALQYRYGRQGAVELQYPDRAADGARQFLYAHYFRAQVDRFEIRFDIAGNDYVVYDDAEEGRHASGVRVTTPDAKEHDVACTARATSRLIDLEHVVRCDADSALNLGHCP